MRTEIFFKATPAEIWPLVSNTDRINNTLGLPVMNVLSTSPDTLSMEVSARLFGLPLSWRERPFEWVEGRYWRSIRDFHNGPIKRIEGTLHIEAVEGGSRVTLSSGIEGNGVFGDLLARYIIGPASSAKFSGLIREIADGFKEGARQAFPSRRNKTILALKTFNERIDKLTLMEPDPKLIKRFSALLHSAFDDELARMRPFELADLWGADRIAVLTLFMRAVKAGLVDMTWEILCTNCSAPKERVSTLAALKKTSHCDSCNIEYGVHFDDSVELRFTVSPAVRRVTQATFCAGSPIHAPFAPLQQIIPPHSELKVSAVLESRSYRLRGLQAKRQTVLRPSPDASDQIAVRVDEPASEVVLFKPGEVALTLKNGGETPLLARVEREDWRDGGVRASLVTTLQEFRDLFSSEVLSPDMDIGIKNVALLFSDLKDSTAMYEASGDAPAYATVRDHFDYIFEIVARRQGAVVKTIGDAVMAVFDSGASALAAAIEIQDRIGELNGRLAPKPPLTIKLGLHQGPALAVNCDGILDYFGSTVNIAARIQGASVGGDIVISRAISGDSACQDVLEDRGAASEDFSMNLKGLHEKFQLTRLRPRGTR